MANHSPLKWGIIGLGKIAHAFVKDLLLVEDVEISAVASRSIEKAKSFANEYNAPKAYGSYTELFQDSEVDVVYIATPHDSHANLSIEALNAGKHVLCEKPLAVNEQQVQAIIDAAKANGVFMMEAFWSRFNPTILAVLEDIKSGKIGEVNYVNVDFTFYREDDVNSRMLNMELAGGSLLDMGVYPCFLAYMTMGIPDEILASARFHETGADLQTSAIFKYKHGFANVMSGFVSQSDMCAKIYGTKGRILIPWIWHEAQGYYRIEGNKGMENDKTFFDLPTKGKGFTYEIEETKKCIQNGQLQSKLWSHQNSLDLIRITDRIRKQTGLKYPFE